MNKNQQIKTLVGTALISSLLSIGIHAYLALNHYKQKLGLVEGKSLCNINSHLNCDVVAASKYSAFLGYPLASWGVMTHLIFSLLLGLWGIGLLKNSDRVLRFSTWLSTFVLLMSLLMAYISSANLGTFCLFCIFTYALSLLMAGCMFAINGQSILGNFRADVKSLFTEHRWVVFCLVMIPTGTWLSNGLVSTALLGDNEETLRLIVQDSINNWQTNPQKSFSSNKGLILQADTGPVKVTIVEFADFLCPHCKVLAEPMHNFVLSHPGVQLIYKPFPLDGVCNDAKIPKGDGLRCELVYSAFCAESLFHKGWDVHEYIFSHQNEWTLSRLDQDLVKMTTDLGLNFDQLKECMKKSEVHQLTLDSANEGNGILGTPTVFVNGKELPHGNIFPVLETAVSSLNP